ncbi:hypothetical protein LCGC14_2574740, partial [marine sediment metagenome]
MVLFVGQAMAVYPGAPVRAEVASGTLDILETWLTTFFDTLFGDKTTDDLTEGSTNLYDNRSWNESSLTGISGGIWQNISGVATYNGNVNITGNLTTNGSILLEFGDLVSEQNPDSADAIRIKGTDYVDVVIGGMT